MVPFWISSPTFLGERPRGPIFGAREDAGAISPPTVRMITILTSSLGGGPMVFIDDDSNKFQGKIEGTVDDNPYLCDEYLVLEFCSGPFQVVSTVHILPPY
jgi:hypothetical protein